MGGERDDARAVPRVTGVRGALVRARLAAADWQT
jgi:hypothetical protein